MKRAYYAHRLQSYHTDEEARDIALIESLGFECVNPSAPEHSRTKRGERTMEEFCQLAASCDLLIFRAFPEGRISSGVHKELAAMRKAGKPILELPSYPQFRHRALTREQTRARMRDGYVRVGLEARVEREPLDRPPLNMALLDVRESDEYNDQ